MMKRGICLETIKSDIQKCVASALVVLMLSNGIAPVMAVAEPHVGRIEQIEISDTEHMTTVHIRGVDLGTCQTVPMHDSEGHATPKTVLVLYDTDLAPELPLKQDGKGAVTSITLSRVAEKPQTISQVAIELSADWPVEVHPGQEIVVEINKDLTVDIDRKTPANASEEAAAPATAPADNGFPEAVADEVIQPADVLYISVSPAEELSRDVAVDQNGRILLPLVGAVEVAGMRSKELARKIQTMLSKFINNPKVDVLIKQFSSEHISILGQIRTPGTYPYRTNLRLMDVVSMAGGFLQSADKSQIRVSRGKGAARQTRIINEGGVLRGGDMSKDFILEPGDYIEVPSGINSITLFGDIVHAGTYDFQKGMRLLDLISQATGFQDGANYGRIKIFRGTYPNVRVFTVSFKDVFKGHMESNILMEPGDIVFIPKRSLWTYSIVATTLSPIATILLAGATVWLAAKK